MSFSTRSKSNLDWQMNASLSDKSLNLEQILREHAPLLVAFSGGVDSSFLLAIAQRVLGDQVTAIIADSPSLPRASLQKARELAAQLGARLEILRTTELEQESYASNPVNRCYFCKAELFLNMDAYAAKRGTSFLAYGENADDASHVRPGKLAAQEFSVCAPLKDAGLTKEEIRQLSRELGLPTADDVAQPCLSSRIPHGVRVTADALQKVELAEEFMRSLGFKTFRVRYLSSATARVQVAPDEMPLLTTLQKTIVGGISAVGYESVEIDPLGYRSPA